MQVGTCNDRGSPIAVGMHGGVRKTIFVHLCFSTSSTKPGIQWAFQKYLLSKRGIFKTELFSRNSKNDQRDQNTPHQGEIENWTKV